jgi:hypothetical protein
MALHPGYTLIEVATQRREEFLREAELLRKANLAAAANSGDRNSPWAGVKKAATAIQATAVRLLASVKRVGSASAAREMTTEP